MTTYRDKMAAQRRASVLFPGTGPSADGMCRFEYKGKLTARGTIPKVSLSGIRWEDRQRLAYRHGLKVRLKVTDRVVAVCGNPRCLDRRHLHVVPYPIQSKQPKDA